MSNTKHSPNPATDEEITVIPSTEYNSVKEAISDVAVVKPAILTPNQAMSTLELESMINRYIEETDKLKAQLKTQKDMYNAVFENDATFSQTQEKEKEIKKNTTALKQKLVKQPAAVDISNRMKDLKMEIKDVQDTLSGLAEQYEKVSGLSQITQDDGNILQIVNTYKVVKRHAEEA